MHTRIRATGLRVSLNLLYLGVLAVALPWLIYRRLTTNRYREGVRSKLFGVKPRDLPPLPQPDAAKQTGTKTAGQLEPNKTVWLHGVSVGEVQLLAALHKAWCQQDPSLRFVVSTTTDSGMALARKLFPDASLVYFPFDFTWAIRSTLNAIQPDLIVLGELELWPNLTSISQERGIPLAVINGRLSDGSFRNYRRLSRFTQPMFSRLSYVGAQTKTYAQRFAQCGTPGNRIETTGSIKFDNVEFERRHESVEQKRSLVSLTGSHTTLVVGSTQSPEERTAVEAFLQLRDQFPELRLIIVPRHPDRFERVFDELQAADVRLIRRSEIGSAIDAEKWEVLLVDTVGELRWWWGVADLAIVGGSFGTRGGQNMIEPAAFGANTAFGPNTSNFRDVVSLLLENDAAEVIPDLADMSDWIGNQLKDPHPGRRRAHNAVQIVRPQQGATGKTIASLSALLADSLRGRTHNPNAPRTELPLKDVSRASTTTDRAA